MSNLHIFAAGRVACRHSEAGKWHVKHSKAGGKWKMLGGWKQERPTALERKVQAFLCWWPAVARHSPFPPPTFSPCLLLSPHPQILARTKCRVATLIRMLPEQEQQHAKCTHTHTLYTHPSSRGVFLLFFLLFFPMCSDFQLNLCQRFFRLLFVNFQFSNHFCACTAALRVGSVNISFGSWH